MSQDHVRKQLAQLSDGLLVKWVFLFDRIEEINAEFTEIAAELGVSDVSLAKATLKTELARRMQEKSKSAL
jgi:hypothetical protein